MKCFYLIALNSLVPLFMSASDSLKRFPIFMLDVMYNHNKMVNGYFKWVEYGNSSVIVNEYDLKLNYSISSNYNYLITKNNKTPHALYIGLGLNFDQYNISHYLGNHSLYNYHTSSGYLVYSQNYFNYKLYSLSILPQITYHIFFKNLVITNKFGCYLNQNFTSNQVYNYNTVEHTSGLCQSLAYVTATNPEGWYTCNRQTNPQYYEDKLFQSFTYSFFYSNGLGFKIKKVMPFINWELTNKKMNVNKPNDPKKVVQFVYYKIQLGITYLF